MKTNNALTALQPAPSQKAGGGCVQRIVRADRERALDPTERWRRAEVTLLVKLPDELCAKAVTMQVGGLLADCLRPLPRNREIAWEVREQQQAREMMEGRRHAAKMLAEDLTAKLLDAFKAKDTINGYSPEEWAAMNPNARAQARGADDVLRDSGTESPIPRCLQRFVSLRFMVCSPHIPS
jgi:hypothetical protein